MASNIAKRTILALVGFGVSACGPDMGQIRLCQQVLAEVAGAPARVTVVARGHEGARAVYLDYEASEETGKKGRVVCRFAGGRLEDGRLDLIGVWTDGDGEYSGPALAFLRQRIGLY